jgi:adenylate kinase
MERRPVVVGLYGVPGIGKSTKLDQLRRKLDEDTFLFLEGSDLLAKQVGGDLRVFQGLDESEKQRCREQVVIHVAKQADESSKAAIVAGHYMLWNVRYGSPEPVWTEVDEATFTHIIYFRVGSDTAAHRRKADTLKLRPDISTEHLNQWQEEEILQLRQICYRSGILFTVIDELYKEGSRPC